MTPEQIRKAWDRCEGATPGPWATRFIYRLFRCARRDDRLIMKEDATGDWADADFCAHARADLPLALSHIEEQRLVINRLENKVYYSNVENAQLRNL